jgi:hypothetical protein
MPGPTLGRDGIKFERSWNFPTKTRDYYIDGDRYKTIARKTPEETMSASSMMLTMFPT